jgi:hypothetical protein
MAGVASIFVQSVGVPVARCVASDREKRQFWQTMEELLPAADFVL